MTFPSIPNFLKKIEEDPARYPRVMVFIEAFWDLLLIAGLKLLTRVFGMFFGWIDSWPNPSHAEEHLDITATLLYLADRLTLIFFGIISLFSVLKVVRALWTQIQKKS